MDKKIENENMDNENVNKNLSIIGAAVSSNRGNRELNVIGNGISNGEYSSYLRSKRNSEIKREKAIYKKDIRKKKISKSLLAAGLIAMGAVAFVGYTQLKGNEKICGQFDEIVSGYGIRDYYSTGYEINDGNGMVSFDEGVKSMVSDAKSAGMDDTCVYIAIQDKFNKDVAEEFVNSDVKESEKIAARFKAYHEGELEQINSRGVSK